MADNKAPDTEGWWSWRPPGGCVWAVRRVYVETGWHFKVPTLCVSERVQGGREAGLYPVAVDDARLQGAWGKRVFPGECDDG